MATLGLLEESLVRLLGAGQVVIPLLVCVLITVASLMFLANRLRQAAVK